MNIKSNNIKINNLDKALANTSVKFKNTELKEAVDDVLVGSDNELIVRTIDDVKNNKHQKEHPEDDHDALINTDDLTITQNILAKLTEKGIDVSKIEKLDNDKQIQAVKQLYKAAKKQKYDDKGITTLDNKNSSIPYIIIGILLTCLAITAVILLLKRTKKGKTENE